ncbi:alpha/beta hydrolase [Spirochaeta isovalerica]|uniref:GPI inositol-deacylase PGAP1-like alpha/beta domain-containing protein n=1 Tax=Spirochaeta isovalerica TaxID=150 RepID=A0A841RD78_9SPIO|nr:alpha/beta hydrolase [Spirochaeta isovalerica]MBB6481341.1 hypothetical protein [Spirochaeta isovalerica]
MGNKPDRKLLQKWWKQAVKEGLKPYGRWLFFRFKLVYWAPVLHPEPLDPQIVDKDHPLYLRERYTPAESISSPPAATALRKKLRNRFNEQLDHIFLDEEGALRFNGLTNLILKNFVKDIDAYYGRNIDDRSRTTEKDAICNLLAQTLKKHRRKKILLIAHSMGSIIAWDVLKEYAPEVKIDTLVTIGSPLGIPVIRGRILKERKNPSVDKNRKAETPENISRAWYNLADFNDSVAINYDLAPDFTPNSSGVFPEDLLVANKYEYDGKENHHKSYGYLRCSEMAGIIRRFLN